MLHHGRKDEYRGTTGHTQKTVDTPDDRRNRSLGRSKWAEKLYQSLARNERHMGDIRTFVPLSEWRIFHCRFVSIPFLLGSWYDWRGKISHACHFFNFSGHIAIRPTLLASIVRKVENLSHPQNLL